MLLSFAKYHGNGNDFVIVEWPLKTVSSPGCSDTASAAHELSEQLHYNLPAFARWICDRNKGIGADGLLIVSASTSPEAAIQMQVFNADGSIAEMCGNGLRTVVKYSIDKDALGITRSSSLFTPSTGVWNLSIQTGAGILSCEYTPSTSSIKINMGKPVFEPSLVPLVLPDSPSPSPSSSPLGSFSLKTAIPELWTEAWALETGLEDVAYAISMGNPHLVVFCHQNVQTIPLPTVGKYLDHHKMFPARINVHFVQMESSQRALVRTWERGSGITQCCGTGACAVSVACRVSGKSLEDVLTAELPGGPLQLEFELPKKNLDSGKYSWSSVMMTGPAAFVFEGSLELESTLKTVSEYKGSRPW